LVPDVITTQVALVDAAHVQSRVVVTVIVPAAPPAGTADIEFSVATSHFDSDGPVTETDDDPQAPANSASADAASAQGRRRGITAPARCNSSARVPLTIARARQYADGVFCEEIRAATKCSAVATAAHVAARFPNGATRETAATLIGSRGERRAASAHQASRRRNRRRRGRAPTVRQTYAPAAEFWNRPAGRGASGTKVFPANSDKASWPTDCSEDLTNVYAQGSRSPARPGAGDSC
jgi:hypothetical protein